MVNVPPRETKAAVNNGIGGKSRAGRPHAGLPELTPTLKIETSGMEARSKIDKSSLLLYFHGAW